MYMYTDDEGSVYEDVDVFHKVMSMFDGNTNMQRILRHSLHLQYSPGLGFPDDDDVVYGGWARHQDRYRTYQRFDGSSDRGNRPRSSNSVYQPRSYYASSNDLSSLSAVEVQAKENDTERKTRLLQESKKSKGKAEKKRKKKLRQKEKKRREKMEREKRNAEKKGTGKGGGQEGEEQTKPGDDKDEGASSGDVLAQAAAAAAAAAEEAAEAESSGSSEQESSDEEDDDEDDDVSCASEELDMKSSFVSKAALIAQRKMEQKAKPVKTERKAADKEQRKTVPDKPDEAQEVGKKDSASSDDHALEDYAKKSTNFANIGNQFASSGNFPLAVKFYTDAIKYNPLEFRLFGNRSFCFEKLQEYDKALCDANLSLGICPGWVKGLFRKGKALAGLKRYDEAARAFNEVLKLDRSYAEAAQELMRVQISQLMEFGFTREQSSNALIIHGTVEKSLEVLSKLNCGTSPVRNGALPLVQVANVTGLSPVLSANTNPTPPPPAAAAPLPPPSKNQDAPKKPASATPIAPVQNKSSAKNQPLELFPVWVGNLNPTVTESMITNLFNKVGPVYSAKVLVYKRCAFVNFTRQELCDEAIQRFNGYELNEVRLAVRYPDRLPPGMGISKFALKGKPPAR